MGVKWYLIVVFFFIVVLIHILLIISDNEHLFICLLTVYYLWRNVCSSPCRFFDWMVVSLLFSCRNSCYILDINPVVSRIETFELWC